MVFYFTSEHDGNQYTLYMGRDKIENEVLIKYAWPGRDVWFHVDNLSSAHVYLRMPEGMDIKSIPAPLLIDCAQLTKANSIEGNKKSTGKVRIVYTMCDNLHKTKGMEDGQVGFHKMNRCYYTEVLERENAIINRLVKTKIEKPTKYIQESREAHDAELRVREKEEKRRAVAEAKAQKEAYAREKEARSYDSLFTEDAMVSNAEMAASSSNAEDDFM